MSKTSQRADTAFSLGKREGVKHLKLKTNSNEFHIHKEYNNPYPKGGINKHFRSAWNKGFDFGSTPIEKNK